MFCFFCGKENSDDNEFCMFCGKRLHPSNDSDLQVKEVHVKKSGIVPAPIIDTESLPENKSISNKLLITVIVLLSLVLLSLGIILFIYLRSNEVNPFALCYKGHEEITDIPEKAEETMADEDMEDKDIATADKVIEDELSHEDDSDIDEVKREEDNVSDDTDTDMQEVIEDDKTENEVADDERIEESTDKNDDKIRIAYAEASSVLNVASKDHATYVVDNVFDGDFTTAWVEGVNGNGEGQVIVLHLDGIHKITEMKIYNGYLKTKRRYVINGRVASAMIDYGNGNVQIVDFNVMNPPEEEVDFAPDQRGETEIKPDGEYETDTITITILNAMPGSKYEDTAISEIEVFGE